MEGNKADFYNDQIVGLHDASLGRSCERHEGCGKELEVGSFIRFKRVILLVDEARGITGGEGTAPETVIKVVLLKGGYETCSVGFLPRRIALHWNSHQLHGQFAQIIELNDYLDEDDSDYSSKKKKNSRDHGVAEYVLLNDIPVLE